MGYSSNPKKAKKERKVRTCPVCGAPIRIFLADEMDFQKKPSSIGPNATYEVTQHAAERYWCCSNYPTCNTYTRVDKNTGEPWGLLAGPSLRRKHILLHKWESVYVASGYESSQFWYMIAYSLGIDNINRVHARYMTEMQCDEALSLCKRTAQNDSKIIAFIQKGSILDRELNGTLVSL